MMDGWVRVLRPFNSISVISRRWEGEHERLCAMKRAFYEFVILSYTPLQSLAFDMYSFKRCRGKKLNSTIKTIFQVEKYCLIGVCFSYKLPHLGMFKMNLMVLLTLNFSKRKRSPIKKAYHVRYKTISFFGYTSNSLKICSASSQEWYFTEGEKW